MTNVETSNGHTALPPPAAVAPPTPTIPPPASAVQTVSEGSWAGRFVALLTPVLAVLAGWAATWVAHRVPGAHLDAAQVTAFMVTASTAALAAGLHWLHGWQQHERMVAEGNATPVVTATTRAPMIRRR